jgi:NADP-dependent 3-hydroxy acid dehydrogenase YdfG
MSNIQGKVIIITGASSGIGEATARYLARQGAQVVLGARREDRLRELAREIVDAGGLAEYRATDVRELEDLKALVGLAQERYGRVDVIVNNAGVMPLSPLDALHTQEWDQMLDVNVKGVLNGIAAVLPVMKEQGTGQVVNVSSVGGTKAVATGAVYCATKSAVNMISEGLRAEVGKSIKVTVVSPGVTISELGHDITDSETRQMMESFREQAIPAEAIAAAIAYAVDQPEGVEVSELTVRPTGGF